jgi:hypothetical protein
VIAAAAIVQKYRAMWPKLIGVEMEGGGVAAALQADPGRPRFLMIRGVSDLADEQKDHANTRAWRGHACDAAAAYAAELLRGGPAPASSVRAAGAAPHSAAPPTAAPVDARALRKRIEKALEFQELEVFVAECFPEIPGGLGGIVSPLQGLSYAAFKLIQHFKSRDRLPELASKLDEYMRYR